MCFSGGISDKPGGGRDSKSQFVTDRILSIVESAIEVDGVVATGEIVIRSSNAGRGIVNERGQPLVIKAEPSTWSLV